MAAQDRQKYDRTTAQLAIAEEERSCFSRLLVEVDARYSACNADKK